MKYLTNYEKIMKIFIRYPSCLEPCCGMYLIPNPVGRWRDSPCYVRHRVVCERDLVLEDHFNETLITGN